MSFWWSSEVNGFLFPGYNIKTLGGFISTCIGLYILALGFEWLKLLQARHRQKELLLRAQQIRTICPQTDSATLLFDSRHDVKPINITLFDR